MATSTELRCAGCGRPHSDADLVCSLCGNLLQRARAVRTSQPSATMPVASFAVQSSAIASAQDERATSRERREPWLYLGIGLVTAPVFALTPFLGFMGWFLASLVHEMGHAALAWLCGMPAIPAIALDGEAAAVHQDQKLGLVVMIALGLGAAAWRFLAGRARWIALALIAVLYPALALTGLKELAHLLAGHGAELAFATLALFKTLDGGFTRSKVERALYGTVGWFLLGKNALLCWGLMHSPAARAEYHENGSFGFANDYIRVAEDVLAWPLERVAGAMLVAALLVLPAAILGWLGLRKLREKTSAARAA